MSVENAKEKLEFGIVYRSSQMARVLDLVRKYARTKVSVLVIGEPGTGKELVARAIHRLSRSAEGPFVPINLAAVPEHLAESALFGHRKGSFTGAFEDREGLIPAANGGSLFLDEAGEIPPPVQVKLLRVLQERKVRRVGESQEVIFDTRLISATNRRLDDLTQRGNIREDFLHRIGGALILLPPLRERLCDVPLLAEHFLRLTVEEMKELSSPSQFSPDAIEVLCAHDWPGNVRELRNVVERSLALCEGEEIIHRQVIEEAFRHGVNGGASGMGLPAVGWVTEAGGSSGVVHDPVEAADRADFDLYWAVYREAKRNITVAAKILRIARNTFKTRMKRWEGKGLVAWVNGKWELPSQDLTR